MLNELVLKSSSDCFCSWWIDTMSMSYIVRLLEGNCFYTHDVLKSDPLPLYLLSYPVHDRSPEGFSSFISPMRTKLRNIAKTFSMEKVTHKPDPFWAGIVDTSEIGASLIYRSQV